MREDFWEFEPTHKLMLAVNHKPGVNDASDSFWDRVVLIPFDVRVEDHQVDPKLLDKLTLELPGIVNWAMAGCLAWQKTNLKRPPRLLDAIREYRDNEDKVGKFFGEALDFDQHQAGENTKLLIWIF